MSAAAPNVIRIIRKGAPAADPLREEAARVLRLCNDCQRCINNCAVFPAAAPRRQFAPGDLDYLANLCHHCGACFQACPYVPPHASGVNVPRTLAQLRTQAHAEAAWPRVPAMARTAPGRSALVTLAASLALLVALALASAQFHGAAGGFYAVIPHGAMVALFALAFGFAAVAIAVTAQRFGRRIKVGAPGLGALLQAGRAALTLRYLDGPGTAGCRVAQGQGIEPPRRAPHHLMFYGLALCFASTCAAALDHARGRIAPHPLDSWPVLLGAAGGTGIVVGASILLWTKGRRDRRLIDPAQQPLDVALLWLLLATAATGLALLALRATAAMPAALVVHLACVLTFAVMIPGGRMVHAPLRMLALVKFTREQRAGNPSRQSA